MRPLAAVLGCLLIAGPASADLFGVQSRFSRIEVVSAEVIAGGLLAPISPLNLDISEQQPGSLVSTLSGNVEANIGANIEVLDSVLTVSTTGNYDPGPIAGAFGAIGDLDPTAAQDLVAAVAHGLQVQVNAFTTTGLVDAATLSTIDILSGTIDVAPTGTPGFIGNVIGASTNSVALGTTANSSAGNIVATPVGSSFRVEIPVEFDLLFTGLFNDIDLGGDIDLRVAVQGTVIAGAPEIDPNAAGAAFAVLLGSMFLLWDRRRKVATA